MEKPSAARSAHMMPYNVFFSHLHKYMRVPVSITVSHAHQRIDEIYFEKFRFVGIFVDSFFSFRCFACAPVDRKSEGMKTRTYEWKGKQKNRKKRSNTASTWTTDIRERKRERKRIKIQYWSVPNIVQGLRFVCSFPTVRHSIVFDSNRMDAIEICVSARKQRIGQILLLLLFRCSSSAALCNSGLFDTQALLQTHHGIICEMFTTRGTK